MGESVRVSRGWVTGRAVIDRRTIHVEDIMAAEEEFPEAVSSNRQVGSQNRTMLATPLLREGVPVGAITISREELRLFSARQIGLLRPTTLAYVRGTLNCGLERISTLFRRPGGHQDRGD